MEASLLVLISTALAAGLGAARSVWVRRFTVNPKLYEDVVTKLIDSGNFERLGKLNAAADKAAYPRQIEAARRAVAALSEPHPAALARATATEAFEAQYALTLQRLEWAPALDVLQLLLGAGALAYNALSDAPMSGWAIALGGLATLLLVDVRRQVGLLRVCDAKRAAPLLDRLVEKRSGKSLSSAPPPHATPVPRQRSTPPPRVQTPESTEPSMFAPASGPRPERECGACGKRGFAPLEDAPEAAVPAGFRGEYCKSCGKLELFKIL